MLLGGTYNANNQKQEGCRTRKDEKLDNALKKFKNSELIDWVMTMQFFGVENVLIRDLTLKDQRRWAFFCYNFKNVTMENVMINLEHHMPNQNQDGLHFWGPGQYLTLKNIQGRTGDDFIALAPDEGDLESSITDVLIDGVVLHEADQGIRLLSRGNGLLDRVFIKNVVGTYKSFGFYVNCWFKGPGGNFGSIIFENINLRPLESNYIEILDPFLFQIGGKMKHLVLRNINVDECDNRNVLKFGYPFYINRERDESDGLRSEYSTNTSVLIDGLHVEEKKANVLQHPVIKITNPIENLVIRDCEFIRHKDSQEGGCFIELDKEARIDNLAIYNVTLKNVSKESDVKNGTIKETKRGM